MSGLFERIGKVVQAEWNARFSDENDGADTPPSTPDAVVARTQVGARRPDVQSAWRMLELEPGADLSQVRAAYRELVRRYHPRSLEPAHAAAARTVVESLTDALEVLEEVLLPLPERPGKKDE